jgi:transposase
MGWNGVGKLIEVQGAMDLQQYCDILDDGVVESFEKLQIPEEERVFQLDNDPKHTSKKAFQWFKDNDIQVLVWPPQSPDINPIEHLWVHLKRALQKYPTSPKGVYKLWERVKVEWNETAAETCQNLIESMPRKIKAVIRANGGHIKY